MTQLPYLFTVAHSPAIIQNYTTEVRFSRMQLEMIAIR